MTRQGEKHLVEARLLDGGARDIELVVPQCDEDVAQPGLRRSTATLNPEPDGKTIGGIAESDPAANASASFRVGPRGHLDMESRCADLGLELTRSALGDLPDRDR